MIRCILQISIFVLVSAGLIACHSADITHCPMLDCPGSKVCDGLGGCALPEQIETCATKQTGDSCNYRDETGAQVGGQCTMGVCFPLGCGNSKVTPDEACDDGNNVSGDGCSADCRSNETCGNGSIDTAAAEQCDDGNVVDGDGCQANCRPGRCGDGITDPVLDEECDAGDANSLAPDAACRPTCEKPRCGDNVLDIAAGEKCDDGNNQSGDGCSGDCRSTEFCGNNVVDALKGEVCDDGNASNGDGCAGDCKSLEICGNNVIDTVRGEVCDDNNTVSGDGCSSDCKSLEQCGNAIVDAVTEQCDLGTAVNSNAPDSLCRTSCKLPICGDTIVDPGRGEQCDQGLLNADAANACRTNCQNPRCGDSIVDTGEVCDDGNTTSGDNCSADCKSLETCGNSIIDVAKGEQCDNAGANSENPNVACRTNCKLRRCGDSVIDTTFGESCDQGANNSESPDAACRTNCTPKRCGDGVMDSGEVCDDGNTTSGDNCSATCASLEVCGNAIVDVVDGEQCDAGTGGNANTPNAPCRTGCTLPKCGDNIVDNTSLGEACDLGTSNSNAADAMCRTNCQPRRCGDGIKDVAAGEVCDDGNVISGDNCSADCLSLETCGNGIIDVAKGEQCDAGTGINANTANAPCRLDCKLPKCGDNIVDNISLGEACDLGGSNSNAADATCRTNCQPRRCGDTIKDVTHGEVCDDGNTTSGDNCSADCLSNETCGNGIIDVVDNEQCDNGGLNSDNPNGVCRTTCQRRICGDNIVDNAFGEACDLGGANSNAANALCRTNCQPRRCGDGIKDTGEICDDGNNTSGDGCSGDCASLENCGNSIVDPAKGEQCDDGNMVDLDACHNDCSLPLCGDGKKDFNEQCDLGAGNNNNANNLCRPDCTPRRCGDGVRDPATGEVCDDGNSMLGDGCRPDCLSAETCGNGVLDAHMGESCDDGNSLPYDGCSSCEPEVAVTYAPGFTPPKRQQPVLVYDGARQRVVMFGGRDGTTLRGDTWEWDGVAWTQMNPEHAPPPRYAAAAAYDSKRKRVVVFGGTTSAVASSDTWEWDGVDWRQRSPATVPSARTGAAAAFDAGSGKVLLFGGTDGTTPNQETYLYDGTNWALQNPTTKPPARFGARMAFDSNTARKNLVMVGGSPNDTHTYTWTWNAVSGTGNWTDKGSTAGPSLGDSTNALAFDANIGSVVLWGGVADTTYEWSGTVWTPVTAVGSTPSARTFITATFDAARKQMILFGGLAGATALSDTSLRQGSTAWTAALAFSQPPARMRAGAGYDPLRKRVVLFGGQSARVRSRAGAGTTLGDVWEWDGRQWGSGGAVSVPTARASTRFDYDYNARTLRMYGGDSWDTSTATDTAFTDVYAYNGASWTLGTATGTREVTRVAGAAFDTQRNKLATFGGVGFDVNCACYAGGGVATTWTWSAATGWTNAANTTPSARRHTQMAYDPIRKNALLFSGVSPAGATIGDTWLWNGTTWSSSTATGPTPRSGSQLVYNPDLGRVVLYGASSLSTGEDLWEWTGTAWSERSLVSTVTERYHAAVTYDAANHGLVAFGGRTSTAGTPPTQGTIVVKHRPNGAAEACTSSQVDYDNDGLAGCDDTECWAQCNPLCPPGVACTGTEPRCGDGTCQSTLFETKELCPQDCGASTGTCGNFQCDTGEDATTCPNDCP